MSACRENWQPPASETGKKLEDGAMQRAENLSVQAKSIANRAEGPSPVAASEPAEECKKGVGDCSEKGMRQKAIAMWAVFGVAATLLEAIYRVSARAIVTLSSGLSVTEWMAFFITVLLLGYFEGYRALQKRFVPHVVARALEAGHLRNPLWVLFAPLYALSLMGAERRAFLRAWVSVALIASAVLVVRILPEPWRGIIDGAVAIALSMGLIALAVQFKKAA